MHKNHFFYGAVIPALFFQFIGAYLYFVAFESESFAQTIYIVTKILLIAWPLFWFTYTKKFTIPLFQRNNSKSILLGLFSGILISAALITIYHLFEGYWQQFSPKIIEAASSLQIIDYYLIFSIFLSVIHSFIEEYYWRWFTLNGLLLKLKRMPAVIISSLAFVSHHFIVALQFSNIYLALLASLGILIVSMGWSFIYIQTKTIAGSWISHLMGDMVIMYIGHRMIFL